MNSYHSETSSRCENKFCSHEAAFQINPIYWWTYKDISFRVVFTWYFITRIEVSFLSKYEIPTRMSFKRTCALNATSIEPALIHFVSGNYVHMKISSRFESSFRSKWPIWNPYRFELHFVSIHVNTSKEPTQHRSGIFSRDEISYRFEFISPLMWTYPGF